MYSNRWLSPPPHPNAHFGSDRIQAARWHPLRGGERLPARVHAVSSSTKRPEQGGRHTHRQPTTSIAISPPDSMGPIPRGLQEGHDHKEHLQRRSSSWTLPGTQEDCKRVLRGPQHCQIIALKGDLQRRSSSIAQVAQTWACRVQQEGLPPQHDGHLHWVPRFGVPTANARGAQAGAG